VEEMWFETTRCQVMVRETARGFVVVSWYPRRREDPDWPGWVTDGQDLPDFPMAEALAGNRDRVDEWVDSQSLRSPN